MIDIIKKYSINIVIDIRDRPNSNFNAEYDKNNLAAHLGKVYEWQGLKFGRNREIQEKTLKHLVYISTKKRVLLLGATADPTKCHRHTRIAKKLAQNYGCSVIHLLRNGKQTTPKFIGHTRTQCELQLL